MKQTMLALILFTVVSCAGNTVAPQNLEQSIASAELSLAGVVKTHANYITTGRVNKSMDEQLVRMESDAQKALDASKFYLKLGDVKNAQSQYEALNEVLLAISQRINELEKQGAKQ